MVREMGVSNHSIARRGNSMDIYQPVIITDTVKSSFKPTRLYVKKLNGLKYFGKTTKDDVHSYTGSGRRWLKHVKKYGAKNIVTLWISDWFACPIEIQYVAINFSKYHRIVESDEWANLCTENGLSGGKVVNNYFSISDYNRRPRTSAHNAAIGNSHRGRIKSELAKAGHVSHAKSTSGREYLRQQNIGKKFWTNGTDFIRSRECPGDGWNLGAKSRLNPKRKVEIDGQIFLTLADAATAFNVHYTSIKHWIKIGKATEIS